MENQKKLLPVKKKELACDGYISGAVWACGLWGLN